MGAKKGGPKLPIKRHTVSNVALPTNFDARQQWGSTCPSTKEVRDQGACGSCWAFGAVEAMTDRTCIASGGKNQAHLSAEDMASCCGFSCGDGCNGGYPSAAWSYWQSTGVVTGANYNQNPTLCFPYTIAACDHHVNGSLPPCGAIQPTPTCTQQCVDGENWSSSKHMGSSAYQLQSVADAQQDLYTNGPFEADFDVYEDFLAYKSGVYTHTTGAYLGGHAIKILGWVVEAGVNYWWVANSWNSDWGDNGFFKIARGTDECGIEDDMNAGLPA
jgi:cathepsin B